MQSPSSVSPPEHPTHTPRRLRARYTARACDECRRRKVKCSGNDPCQGCVTGHTSCKFSLEGQRSRKRSLLAQRSQADQLRTSRQQPQSNESALLERISILEEGLSRQHDSNENFLMQRIALLEERLQQMQSELSRNPGETLPEPGAPSSVEQHGETPPGPSASMQTPRRPNTSRVSEEDDTSEQRIASMLTQKRVLQSFSIENSPNDGDIESASGLNNNRPLISADETQNPRLVSCRLTYTPRLVYLLRFFLAEHNFFFHCVDDDFIDRLSRLLEEHAWGNGQLLLPTDKPDLIALTALACMVLAQAECLDIAARDLSTIDSHQTWYLESRRILAFYPSEHPINDDIVRVHFMETFYNLVQDNTDVVTQSMAVAITSAFTVNLNNESKWALLTDSEKSSRRCLWWSVYLMDRQVAYRCGRPYLIRDAEVNVTDLTKDINILVSQNGFIQSMTSGGEDSNAGNHPRVSSPGQNLNPSSILNSVSTADLFKLRYSQCLIEFSRLFTRAWDSFFCLCPPKLNNIREEVESLDALFLRLKRNLPNDMSWNTSLYQLYMENGETDQHVRVRLLLFTRINLLRLAIYHASVRMQKKELNGGESQNNAEYEYTIRICEEISCQTIEALGTYLNSRIPGSTFTTFATLGILESIYHLISMTWHPTVSPSTFFRLSPQVLDMLSGVAQTLHDAASAGRHMAARSVSTLVEGILKQQRRDVSDKSANSDTAAPPFNINAPSAIPLNTFPSLKYQVVNGPIATWSEQSVQNGQECAITATGPIDLNTRVGFNFDSSLLPGLFLDNSSMYGLDGDMIGWNLF